MVAKRRLGEERMDMRKMPPGAEMKFIGLLTHQQKQAGYFVSQDEDFIYLWHRRNGNPGIIAVFLYENATVKQIRDAAQVDAIKSKEEA